MSAPGSRLARQMRPQLGTGLWDEFAAHANRHYKARWLCAFTPASGVLRCVGALDGAPCAHARGAGRLRAGAGMAECEVGAALERLHLDHERPLHATCTGGARQCARRRGRGTTGRRRCATTCLGCASAAHGAACVRFRCGPPRDAEGVVLQLVDHAYLLPSIVAGCGWWLSGFSGRRDVLCSCSRVGACIILLANLLRSYFTYGLGR